MPLEKSIVTRIVNILEPFMKDEDDRKAEISLALWNCPILPKLDWKGGARYFTINLIAELDTYGDWNGKPALVHILEHWRGEVGENVKKEIDAIISELQPHPPSPSPRGEGVTRVPEPTKPNIASLLDVPPRYMERGAGGEVAPARQVLARADELLKANKLRELIDYLTPLQADTRYPQSTREAMGDYIQHAQAEVDKSDAERRQRDELDEIILLVNSPITRRRGIERWKGFRQANPSFTTPTELAEVAVLSILPPPFAWCLVTAGSVTLEDESKNGGTKGGKVSVAAFSITKYPITNAQYQAFIDAGGYGDERRWTYSADAKAFWEKNNKQPHPTAFDGNDDPRTNVSWFESVAFCLWLSAQTGLKISLPTESQWQRAAQGDDGRNYPWGNQYDSNRCNAEKRIKRTTSVTRYDFPPSHPESGMSPFGAVDMAGNVWDWCLDAWGSGDTQIDNRTENRVLRGGAWGNTDMNYLRVANRGWNIPGRRYNYNGFRCACL